MSNGDSTRRRVHIVLIPGFAGFDALGQIEYYAGVTPRFEAWNAAHPDAWAALHYFDNLPTAAVQTRAARLGSWLAKRVARGELGDEDRIALVGHSTGGLDLRQLLLNLRNDPAPVRADTREVRPERLLRMIDRAVFLSVPQLGTNIADFVRNHGIVRQLVLEQLRVAVAGADASTIVDRCESWLVSRGAENPGGDFFLALRDALEEIDAEASPHDPQWVARAHEAAAHLELWLRHMASDFGAIDDLAVRCHTDSPAHRTDLQRAEERELWQRHGIATMSFATQGRPPLNFVAPDCPGPLWNPWSNPSEWVADDGVTDLPYRLCYHACAHGPFGELAPGLLGRELHDDQNPARVELHDNDGIVNTASMLWPDEDRTFLVSGDHGDIIGHYRLEPETPRRASRHRCHDSYDLLRSGVSFHETFVRVWDKVFDFCVSP